MGAIRSMLVKLVEQQALGEFGIRLQQEVAEQQFTCITRIRQVAWLKYEKRQYFSLVLILSSLPIYSLTEEHDPIFDFHGLVINIVQQTFRLND